MNITLTFYRYGHGSSDGGNDSPRPPASEGECQVRLQRSLFPSEPVRKGPSGAITVGSLVWAALKAQGTTVSCWKPKAVSVSTPSSFHCAVHSVRLWVRRKGILPTTCSLQPPLHEGKHPPLERLQKGRKQYLCHYLSLVRTFHNPAGTFPSYSEQSSRSENCLPNPLYPLPLHTFAHFILLPRVSLVLLTFPKSSPTLWKPKQSPSFPFQGLS